MVTLKLGSSGPQVAQLQRMLITAGHSLGEADGKFGPRTESAVRAFQQGRGLTADGKAGVRTMAALKLNAVKEEPQEEAHTGGFKLSDRSLKNLAQCHVNLQKIADALSHEFEFVVVCGHRNKADQEDAFRRGTSKAHWPNSKHNSSPSQAFDAYPHPIPLKSEDWDKPEYLAKFAEMRRRMQSVADRLGIKVRFISWDRPHIELKAS